MRGSIPRPVRYVLALVWAGLLLTPSLYLGARTIYRLLTYESADGTARYEGRGGRKGVSRHTIGYAVKGRGYAVKESAVSWLGLGYEDGEKVEVLYPADDPAAGVAATFGNLWLWPLLLGLFALPFIVPVAHWAWKWEPPYQGMDAESVAMLESAKERRRGRVAGRAEGGGEDY